MPQRRAHYHARRRGEPVNAAPSVERRIVTFVTSLATPDTSGDDIKTTFSDSLEQDHGELELGDQAASSTSSLPSAILASTITGSAGGALFTESVTSSSSESLASETSTSTSPSATKASETSSASATSSSSSSSGGSMDVAVKAGIALAVLGGLLIVLGIAYFFIMRRRKQIDEQQRQAAADEKLNGSIEDGPPPPTPAKPPRLSLRPMTGLFTAFSSPGQGELRAGSKSPAAMARAPVASAWDRAMTSESQTDHNPFGSGAERVREEPGTPKNPMTPISEASTHFASPQQGAGLTPAPRGVSALTTDTGSIPRMSGITMDSATVPPLLTRHLQVSPCGSADVSPIESEASFPVGQAMSTSEPVPAGSFTSTTASGGALTIERQLSERRQSVRKENVPAPLDLTLPPKLPAVPPSPSGTEFSFQEVDPEQSPIPSTSAAEIAAAGGPANSTVHRVQLDFNPTLDDEMGLQAGQLVRLLHEYDDGWVSVFRKSLPDHPN